MDLFSMQYAVAVADQKSFSLAAQICGVTQSALSQQISRLEKELGTVLFHRSSKAVTLTQAGEAFVRSARGILQSAEALREEMALYSGLRKGQLRLGIITSLECIHFGDMLSAFCRTYPEISVSITQSGTHRLSQLLEDREIDAALINRPPNGLRSTLSCLRLGDDRYSLAVPAIHHLAGRKSVSLRELKEERFIFHQPGQVASELCLAACREAGFEPKIVCRSENPSVALYMVQGGLGVAFLPSEEFYSRTLSRVREVPIREPIIKEVVAAWRRDNASPLVAAFTDFSREWGKEKI